MTEINPADRQDIKPADGSRKRDHSPIMAARLDLLPVPGEHRTTYDHIYWRLDSVRNWADARVIATQARIKAALALGDEATAAVHRAELEYNITCAAELLAAQIIIGDVGINPVCKAELARAARERKQQAEADARRVGEATQCD